MENINSSLGNIKFGKLLWQGSFSSGSITVPNLSDYTCFVFKSDYYTAVGTAIIGGNCYRNWYGDNSIIICYRFNMSGDTLIIDDNCRGMHENESNIPVKEIYGVF